MKKILKKNHKRMWARALRKKGLTYQAIADKIGVSRERVRQYIKGEKYNPEARHRKYLKALEKELAKTK